jgi:hypothetical protein
MGNANGKFDATTVALYNGLDLIQQRTYESKKTAAKVMTNRSAKALHRVKSGFEKKFRHRHDKSPDGLSLSSSYAQLIHHGWTESMWYLETLYLVLVWMLLQQLNK